MFIQESQGFLSIVEVYFDWAGPCHAMTRYIKKIKMELGEERDLKFMMACADYIPALKPFHGSCRPVWLFIAEGRVGLGAIITSVVPPCSSLDAG